MLLAQDPKLLLVDEPVAGMTDSRDRRRPPAAQGHRETRSVVRGRARHELRARTRTRRVTCLAEGSVLRAGSIAFEGKALDRSAAYDRARSGIGFVPQGREIFPLLTVRENLESGYAPLKRARPQRAGLRVRAVSGAPADARRGAAATCRAASSSNSRSGARW
jgi:ABC-type uncharacterized transport system ATPase subunit